MNRIKPTSQLGIKPDEQVDLETGEVTKRVVGDVQSTKLKSLLNSLKK